MSEKDKFLFYTAEDGAVKVEVLYKEETVWLTQKALAELFGVQRPAITKHLKNIFETNELSEKSVSSILEHTAVDGKAYGTKYYNLDAIIAVGYRVNSYQATQFRIWATKTLKEFIIKGLKETLCDPACGTGGFLLAAHDYVVKHNPNMSADQKRKGSTHSNLFRNQVSSRSLSIRHLLAVTIQAV